MFKTAGDSAPLTIFHILSINFAYLYHVRSNLYFCLSLNVFAIAVIDTCYTMRLFVISVQIAHLFFFDIHQHAYLFPDC